MTDKVTTSTAPPPCRRSKVNPYGQIVECGRTDIHRHSPAFGASA